MKRYNAPKVKESKGIQIFTTIWLVPFLALIIALWLAFQYYAKIGPTIKIAFKSNAGLIANQSQIKLRNVTVGMVTKVSLSEDGKGVIVQARMNKEVASYLNHKAKLWIVHPDVDSNGVSGLDTLLSGSYIELHGAKEEDTQHYFIGLENPYIDTEAQGKYYLLSAPESYNISEGSNIYYRMIKIGRVERVGIAPNGEKINFTVFIEEKYNQYINNKSQFYARSTLSVDISKGKLDMRIATLSQMVHGGVSIYTPLQTLHHKNLYPIKSGQLFPLYKNLAEMRIKHLMQGEDTKMYQFIFNDSSQNLEIGSAVEFHGFQVGYISDIERQFDEQNQSISSIVYALLYLDAFKGNNKDKKGEEVLKDLVNNQGLKGTLKKSIPLIGSQFIDLTFDNTIKMHLTKPKQIDIFPTTSKKITSNIMDDVKKLLVKLEKLPLEKLLISATNMIEDNNKPVQKILTDLDKMIVDNNKPIQRILTDLDGMILDNKKSLKHLLNNLEKVINNFNKTVNNLNQITSNKSLQKIPENLNDTLLELEHTLLAFQNFTKGYDADSKFSAELSATLRELSLAAESIEHVSRKLERKPNSLLLGDD